MHRQVQLTDMVLDVALEKEIGRRFWARLACMDGCESVCLLFHLEGVKGWLEEQYGCVKWSKLCHEFVYEIAELGN